MFITKKDMPEPQSVYEYELGMFLKLQLIWESRFQIFA